MLGNNLMATRGRDFQLDSGLVSKVIRSGDSHPACSLPTHKPSVLSVHVSGLHSRYAGVTTRPAGPHGPIVLAERHALFSKERYHVPHLHRVSQNYWPVWAR